MLAQGLTRIALVGTGEMAELVFISLRERGLEPVVVASGADSLPEHFMGLPVVGLDELNQHDWQVILVAGRGRQRRESQRLSKAGVDLSKVRFAGDAAPVSAEALPQGEAL